MGDDEPFSSWVKDHSVGELLIPRYDHVRFYLDVRLTSWEDEGDEVCPLLLLEITRDPLSTHIFKVLLRDKIRYVYADDMMSSEGTR